MRGLVVPILLATLTVTASSAYAASSIEGTWSYSGGSVVVTSTAPEDYQGVVVRAVKSAPCTHKVGELIWEIHESDETDLYRGGQAFRDAAGCAIATGRGFARWMVSGDSAELCFVAPDDDESRPTCETLERVDRSSSSRATFASTVVLPSNKRCRSSRTLRIRLRRPRADTLVSARLSVTGRRSTTIARGKLLQPIDLRRLPRGRYVVRVTLRTAAKKTISGSRTYRTCA